MPSAFRSKNVKVRITFKLLYFQRFLDCQYGDYAFAVIIGFLESYEFCLYTKRVIILVILIVIVSLYSITTNSVILAQTVFEN